jgi:hypothetical protein
MRNLLIITLALAYPFLVLWQVHRSLEPAALGALRDRVELVSVLAAGVLFLMFARALVDWEAVPPWLWLIGLLPLAAAVVLSGRGWTNLVWLKAEHPRRRAASGAAQLLLSAAIFVILI